MSHKKVNVSLPTAKFQRSANSNKNIKSNDTEFHFVFLLLLVVGLDAMSRAYFIQGTIVSRDT